MKNNKVKSLVFSGLLLAIGVLLPQVFHFSGVPNAGPVFLPMHISVFLAGFMVGPIWGLGVGVLTPVLSFIVTGGAMPPIPILYFMMIELATYAFVAGLCSRNFKLNPYFSQIIAMICGRGVYALVLLVFGVLLGMKVPPVTAVWTAIVTGLPGIIIQLVIIPPIVYALKKGGFVVAASKSN
ncbi:ECF transporter S component [Paludicola sp. MB14-C6]|uniref:ECF transporter S component n=1 Tax=Paludihabitans sp. MB14-C6 TaxID=3070656 RepID=UPI0027DD975F|nr:ECF transporter S component [Paludicola sp. MB14-C6]WMJ22575.1 ECF transporter S component [Paludicola sp. MB14-C6]